MLFNSIEFLIFLPIVFAVHWAITKLGYKAQNTWLVIASYVFYGWWDWRFLLLIIASTMVDFIIAQQICRRKEKHIRYYLLWSSVLFNLGILGFFKYFNFFLDTFIGAFTFLGYSIDIRGLDIVLPVGISFYTFQTMSYTIDVYRGKLKATSDWSSFAGYVSFFPQLVAGPIERATHLLPQFLQKRSFNYEKSVDGLRQILWGFVKKLVIADGCAEYADLFFTYYYYYPGSALFLGAIFFAFQIYGDFSGYSDIAIGTARLFGFDLRQNFAFPYFSRNIAEFWRRWHISLSTWFRDYLYIPLGGSRVGKWKQVRNTFIIFLVSGFWHGANWTFIVWGVIHAFLFLPLLLLKQNRKFLNIVAKNRSLPNLKELLSILFTFTCVTLAWVFFRANDLNHAYIYFKEMFSPDFWVMPNWKDLARAKVVLYILSGFVVIEWIGRRETYAIQYFALNWPRLLRWIFYAGLVFLMGVWMDTKGSPFIYFQF